VILYYAVGGGLGHLTRARAVLHTLGIRERVTLLTASRHADDPRVTGDSAVLRAPNGLARDPARYARWLRAAIERVGPTGIYVDAFPAGIVGEWGAGALSSPGVPVVHVARLLRWHAYRARVPGTPPRFARTLAVEPLGPEHEQFLRRHSEEVRSLDLVDPDGAAEAELPSGARAWLARGERPRWLVVHAGPEHEVAELIGYAREVAWAEGCAPRLALVARVAPAALPADVAHLDVYPATPLFAEADRIVTACGFNAMRQTAPWRARHRFVPFPRAYDDQFLRAARRRAGGVAAKSLPVSHRRAPARGGRGYSPGRLSVGGGS
jgi:hypothetical protein